MSEKIYACLLRIFPPAFRRRYQQEALRLLRDRLGEEKGVFRRLRLSFDLLADLLGALPQAYRNSYPQAAHAAPEPHLAGAPAFEVLQKEPMRRAALVAGGLVSLTAMAAFIYIMQGPIGFHPAERKGHRSPIEMVMEHLNQPVSDNLPADAARPVAAGVAPAAMAAAQNPGIAARATLRAGATQSSPASDRSAQTALIRVPAGSGNPLAGQAPATAASSLPPVWTGSWRAVDGPADLPIWFSLRQDSAKLSGAGASDSATQYPVLHGQVFGDSVRFELQDGQRTLLYDLRAEGNGLRGTVTVSSANVTRTVAIRFERAH